MKQYEYDMQFFYLDSDECLETIDKELDEMGEAGWELKAIKGACWVFCRERPEEGSLNRLS
jgi:hypothetical protein